MRRFSTLSVVSVLVGSFLLGTSAGWGGIEYDAGKRTILVSGFPREHPAMLADVRAADEARRWGVVTHGSGDNSIRVAANLVIGMDDGSTTWFRIGAARPGESLILGGNLLVSSPKPAGYKTYEGENVLQLGHADDPEILASLRFDCARDREFGIRISDGARVEAFHALMGALQSDDQHDASWYGSGTQSRFVNTVFTGIENATAFGTGYGAGQVKGCVFENMAIVLGNGVQWCEDCTFRNVDEAVRDGGALCATLINCRFENNTRHWSLRHSQWGILAIDCFFGQQEVDEVVVQRWRNPRTGLWQYPKFIAKRHIVLEVMDPEGGSVRGARVTLGRENGAQAGVGHGFAVTGTNGRTPAPGEEGALLVTDHVIRASGDPNVPVRVAYTYEASVVAAGFKTAVVRDIDPDPSWVAAKVTLERAE